MAGNSPFSVAHKCDTGCLRSFNEDAVSVRPELGLLVVADGMGGHNAGDVAARMAVEIVERHVETALSNPDTGPVTIAPTLRRALEEADGRIRAACERIPGREHMGCTVAAALLYDNRAYITHVGDTRAYLLRDGELRLLTRDHSPSQRALEAGLSDEAAMANSHNRHLVSQAVGAGLEPSCITADIIDLQPHDLLLLCSDGLNDMVDGVDIELVLNATLDNVPMAADQLVMIARDCGGHDNISVALARVDAPFPASGRPVHIPSRSSLLNRLRGWFGRA